MFLILFLAFENMKYLINKQTDKLSIEKKSPIWLSDLFWSVNWIAVRLLVPVSLFLLWWLASNHQWMPAQILPTPQATWHTFLNLAGEDLFQQLAISLGRLFQELALDVIGGIAFGFLLGYSPTAERYLSSIFYALAIVPTLAWLPLLMIWLGIENALKVFLIFKATLIPITLHTQTGVRDIQPRLKEMAQVLQLGKQDLLFKLILPSALPHFFIGFRLALAAGWTTLIAVELLASSEGIGYLMVTGRQLFQLDIVFVAIALIALVGLLLDRIFQSIEQRFIFWPHATLSAHHAQKKQKWQSVTPWVIPITLLLLWIISTGFHWVAEQVLPSPLAVWSALGAGVSDHSLLDAMFYSLWRALLGLLLGGSIGLFTGLLLGMFKLLEDVFAPTLNTLRLIAIFAWIPLITAWFGLADLSKIVFISIATFFPMCIATWKGVSNVPHNLYEAALILRLSVLQRLRVLILPSITPSIFAGFRLALLYSWMASFGAEYLMGSGVGIGSYMMAAQQNFEMDRVIAATMLVAVLGALLFWLGKTLEHRVTAWRNTEGSS